AESGSTVVNRAGMDIGLHVEAVGDRLRNLPVVRATDGVACELTDRRGARVSRAARDERDERRTDSRVAVGPGVLGAVRVFGILPELEHGCWPKLACHRHTSAAA